MKRCKRTRFRLPRSCRTSERRSLSQTSVAFEVPRSRLKTQSSAGEELFWLSDGRVRLTSPSSCAPAFHGDVRKRLALPLQREDLISADASCSTTARPRPSDSHRPATSNSLIILQFRRLMGRAEPDPRGYSQHKAFVELLKWKLRNA
ncbi:hypothetical protein ROHU_028505 [Labeo rohita]|uniref:Uncharacterized protein n=1 Tax=Labeo rohita TaxID=84645 RepID=A0A498M2X0_LABRO|nr:hypothetical protein ROHU_028505 [Labeo rohita]